MNRDGEKPASLLATRVLFGCEMVGLSASDVLDIFADVPPHELPKTSFEGAGLLLVEVVVVCGIAPPKGAARCLIESGGINVNNWRITDTQTTLDLSTLIEGQYLVRRKGAKDYHVVRAV